MFALHEKTAEIHAIVTRLDERSKAADKRISQHDLRFQKQDDRLTIVEHARTKISAWFLAAAMAASATGTIVIPPIVHAISAAVK